MDNIWGDLICLKWKESNGSYLAYVRGQYCGLVSQNPDDPRVVDPGKWCATWHSPDGGLESTGAIYDTAEDARGGWIHHYTGQL